MKGEIVLPAMLLVAVVSLTGLSPLPADPVENTATVQLTVSTVIDIQFPATIPLGTITKGQTASATFNWVNKATTSVIIDISAKGTDLSAGTGKIIPVSSTKVENTTLGGTLTLSGSYQPVPWRQDIPASGVDNSLYDKYTVTTTSTTLGGSYTGTLYWYAQESTS
jgi:hypothetical protein